MLLYYLYQLNQLFSHQTYVNFGCLATILIHLKKKEIIAREIHFWNS